MLLQEIRARQAAKEQGVEVRSLEIAHKADPYTILNGQTFRLIFPRFMLGYGALEKTLDWCFVGKATPKRLSFISKMEQEYPGKCRVTITTRGRQEATRDHDVSYFEMLGRSKFAACPNGDFVWTYRFFEAILCRAIPVIEFHHPLYQGYHCVPFGKALVYDKAKVEANLAKVEREMMLI